MGTFFWELKKENSNYEKNDVIKHFLKQNSFLGFKNATFIKSWNGWSASKTLNETTTQKVENRLHSFILFTGPDESLRSMANILYSLSIGFIVYTKIFLCNLPLLYYCSLFIVISWNCFKSINETTVSVDCQL